MLKNEWRIARDSGRTSEQIYPTKENVAVEDVALSYSTFKTMRRILVTLTILVFFVVALSALWIFRGRQVSLFIDRFGTIETASERINSIAYQGSGTGGILHVNDLGLSLNDVGPNHPTPNIGTTKDDQLALAVAGKVFAFGPPRSEENLAAVQQEGDDASLTVRRSVLSWPTPFDFNFITGRS